MKRTHTSDVVVVSSNVELIALGFLSQNAPPSSDALGDVIAELGLPDTPPDRAHKTASDTLEVLRTRGLADAHNKLTDAGALALRSACGLARRPSWSAFRSRHFARIALGLPPTTKSESALGFAQRLGGRLGVASAASIGALCDELIMAQLGMAPGKLTLARIRTHVLNRRAVAAGPRKEPADPPKPPSPPPPATPDLLVSVRETLPHVGAEGRFGSEKVFVSALWHRLSHPDDMSLDHFKRWLVTANRNRWLTLARADVVGAMDPVQVRESEIRDLGATFHFVLDPAHNPATQQGAPHAR